MLKRHRLALQVGGEQRVGKGHQQARHRLPAQYHHRLSRQNPRIQPTDGLYPQKLALNLRYDQANRVHVGRKEHLGPGLRSPTALEGVDRSQRGTVNCIGQRIPQLSNMIGNGRLAARRAGDTQQGLYAFT